MNRGEWLLPILYNPGACYRRPTIGVSASLNFWRITDDIYVGLSLVIDDLR